MGASITNELKLGKAAENSTSQYALNLLKKKKKKTK